MLYEFKKIIKKRVYAAALNELNNTANDHSKSQPLMKNQLQCEKYISDPRFQVHEVQLLFSLRSRSYPVKANLKNKYRQNLACFLCNSSSCDQQHLMTCVVLRKFVPDLINTKVKYSDIFSDNVDKQLAAVKLFDIIDKQRERLLETLGVN